MGRIALTGEFVLRTKFDDACEALRERLGPDGMLHTLEETKGGWHVCARPGYTCVLHAYPAVPFQATA